MSMGFNQSFLVQPNLDKNLEKSLKKKYFFLQKTMIKKKEKCYYLSFFPFEDISLRPEIPSPPYFRIQGGSPERYKEVWTDGLTEIVVSNIGSFFVSVFLRSSKLDIPC